MSLLSTLIAQRVGQRLRELRLDAELSQAELARRVYSHRPIVSRAERGTHLLSLEEIDRYARALELDVATVLVCLDDGFVAAQRAAELFAQGAAAMTKDKRRT